MTILTETSIGNIFFFIFLAIFVLLFILLFILKSTILDDFNKTNLKDSRVRISTFIYLLSLYNFFVY